MSRRRVAVVGIGTVNPAGNSVEDSWKNISAGMTGIDQITRFDTEEVGVGVTLAGEVKEFDLTKRIDKREARHEALFTQYALYAAEEALEMSGLLVEEDAPSYDWKVKQEEAGDYGVSISCGIGGLDVIEEQHVRGMERGYTRVNPFFIPMAISNMAAARIAISHGLKGMCTCPVTACAGGTNAIGDAFHRIRDGYETVMVCGGTESCITPLAVSGFSNMKALSHASDPKRASVPFDAERSGFVMGEGAGILVLEEWEHAKARGAKILAEMVGYGSNCDAYHITSPSPSGEGGAACMRLAISDAGLQPEDIDYINAHGTSTHLNDVGETKAIHAVFGEAAKNVAISSTKGVTGHLLGGAGGVEAVISVKTLQEQLIPPTANYQVKDPECDLDYVPNTARKAKVEYVLSNSLGFGGHNACVVFKRGE